MTQSRPRTRVRMPADEAPTQARRIEVERRDPRALKTAENQLKKHSGKKIALLAAGYREFGFLVPVVVDAEDRIICGHARVLAAIEAGLKDIPIIPAIHLNEAQRRAFAIADNKITELGAWDKDALQSELSFLSEIDLDFSLEITGFQGAEIDLILAGGELQAVPDSDDDRPSAPEGTPVCQPGDLWVSTDGRLKIICGDSRLEETYRRLLGEEKAALIASDPPYNLSITKLVSGNGKAKHSEFHEASGEMSVSDFRQFLRDILALYARFSKDGSLHYIFMDWRHIDDVIWAGREVFQTLINVCVWRKTTGGMGGLYRSAHEFCPVFKHGSAPHVNNVQLGRYGRNRSNVWTHQGANTFRKGRDADLAAHPTVKPVQMIADIILDASQVNDLVLDGFLGSGTTLLAAHRTNRRGAGIEIDPAFVDVAIRRIQTATGLKFVHAETGQLFDDAASGRLAEVA